jgi:hypothetical protein
MHHVGTILQFVGGAITRVAGSALLIGVFFVLVGVTPWQYVAELIGHPPAWMQSSWFRLTILVLGLAVIWFALNFNRWSLRQRAIDSLAEDISWAISDLLNRKAEDTGGYIDQWQQDFNDWCSRVSAKLENRAFFTRADQLHFDRLGFVDPILMYQNPRLNHLLSQLRLKIDRLRDIINWTQMRKM